MLILNTVITVYNSEDMEATKGHINRQMGKEDVVCVYIYIYIGILVTKQNSAFSNNTDGPREYYACWNKSHRERQILNILICWI